MSIAARERDRNHSSSAFKGQCKERGAAVAQPVAFHTSQRPLSPIYGGRAVNRLRGVVSLKQKELAMSEAAELARAVWICTLVQHDRFLVAASYCGL